MKAVLLVSIVIVIGVISGFYVYLSDVSVTGDFLRSDKSSIKQALENVKIANETPKSINKIVAENTPKQSTEDICKAFVCKNSTKTCADGFVSSCANTCGNGTCSNCQPSCVGHEKKTEMPKSQSTTSISRCTESWSCLEWSSCTNSQQTRSCSDSNDCGTTENKPTETQYCLSQTQQLNLLLSTNNQIIQRGSDVVITAKVTDGQNIISGANLEMILTYASGTQISNSSLTDSNGEFVWTKRIGGNSKTGIFKVDAKATKADYLDAASSLTFEVVNKTG